jgi:hypothetical protein
MPRSAPTGIEEIGITGVGAAVANAIYNATGKRVRELPITLDKLPCLWRLRWQKMPDWIGPARHDLCQDRPLAD